MKSTERIAMASNSSVPTTFSDVPPHVYDLIVEFLIGAGHNNVDLRKAHIRATMRTLFPFIVLLYAAIVAVGVVANIGVMVHVIYHKLCKDATYAFIINNAVSDIVKCVLVLPLSLYVLMVQNWLLGELLCSFLPMLQDIPLHVTTLTFVLTAWDRYRYIRNPNKPRLPAFVCAVGSWLTALCLVLPYPIYIIYVDLGNYSTSFDGIGFCVVNLTDDMQEYMRGIFLIMYAGPLATISYLYVKSSRELQTTATIVMYETRHRESRSRATDSQRTSIDMRGSRGESDLLSQYSRSSYRSHQPAGLPGVSRHQHSLNGDYSGEIELDVGREKRTNKYLASMVTMYAIFMGPLMVLRVARLALLETYENAAHFDLTYTAFVWLAFLPTCTTPALFAAWHMSRPTKERLRGYFRISSRKIRRTCEPGAAEPPCVTSHSPPPTAAAFVPTASNRSATVQLAPQPPQHKANNQLHQHHHQHAPQGTHGLRQPHHNGPLTAAVHHQREREREPRNQHQHQHEEDFEYYPSPMDDLMEIFPENYGLPHHNASARPAQDRLSYPD